MFCLQFTMNSLYFLFSIEHFHISVDIFFSFILGNILNKYFHEYEYLHRGINKVYVTIFLYNAIYDLSACFMVTVSNDELPV